MIFKPILIYEILFGEKTVTRRPCTASPDATTPDPCRYKVGKVYAIQPGMARPSVARIRVLSVDRVALGSIDDADAMREGFAGRAEFVEYWKALYPDDGFGRGMPVWRIEFEVVDVMAVPCGGCEGHGYEPVSREHAAEMVEVISGVLA